jgi:integrase
MSTSRFWILPAFGNIQVSKLTRARIEKWLEGIANSPRHARAGKELEPPRTEDEKRARKSTANRVLKTLKAALTFCVQRNLADSPDRPWQLVSEYRGTVKARTRFLTLEEQVKLVNACKGDFRNLVCGALLTGCRYGELKRMLCRDYDPQNGTVLVAESKGGKPRHIYLTEEGRKLFDELTAGRGPDDFVFTNGEQGRKKATRGKWRRGEQAPRMSEACKKAGIEPATFHELRHTYASTLVNRGCSMPVVAKLLGHANTMMTEKHYAHLARNTVRDELLKTMPMLGIVQ